MRERAWTVGLQSARARQGSGGATRCTRSIECAARSRSASWRWPSPLIAVDPACAQSKSSKAKAAATALPEPLTHDSIRELVSRLSDEDVRKLLIDQLDRSAAPAKGKGDKAMSGMVEENAGMVRERLGEFRDAFVALPATLREVIAKLDDPDGPSVLLLVAALVAGALVVGWLAERLYHFALRNYRKRLAPPTAETFMARSFRLAVGLALDLVGIGVFALAFLALFLALWQGHGLRRIAILEVLIAIVAVRVTWLFAQFLLGGAREGQAPAVCRRSRAALAPVRRAGGGPLGSQQFRAVRTEGRRRERADARPDSDVHVAAGSRDRAVDRLAGSGADRRPDPRRWHAWRRRRLARRPVAGDRDRVLRRDRRRARLRHHQRHARRGRRRHPERAAGGGAADRRHDAVPGRRGGRVEAGGRRFRGTGIRRRLRDRVSPRHPHRRRGGRPVPARRAVGRQPVRGGAGEHGRQDLELALRHLHRAAALVPAVGAREDGDRPPAGGRRQAGPGSCRRRACRRCCRFSAR